MKFHQILFRKLRFSLLFLICILLSGSGYTQEKAGPKGKYISIDIKVLNDNGNPLPGAQVMTGGGIIPVVTGKDGSVNMKGYLDDFITVSAPGHERMIIMIDRLLEEKTVILKKSRQYASADDEIPIPFSSMNKRSSTGSSMVITGEQLQKYPSSDIRNAFTGMVTGLQVTERNGSPGLSPEEKIGLYGASERVTLSSRGQNLVYVVDDILMDITEIPIDPSEIESATIITDIVGKAKYGPAGADGIVYIKTTRGKARGHLLNVSLENGVSMMDRFPEMVNGADYARLNNMARENDGLTALYSIEDIESYAKNDPYDLYHPSVDFRALTLKNTRGFRRVNVSSRGGNEAMKYFSNISYDGEGDIFKIGSTADYNRVSARSNLDVKINDVLKAQCDVYGNLTFRRSPNYGYATSESSSYTDIDEFNSAISTINTIPPVAFPIYANNDPALKSPWYGVSNTYKFNPVGDLVGNGNYTETSRMGSVSFALDYDMSAFIRGLRSRTSYQFNALNLVRLGNAKNYIAYIVTPSVSTKTDNDTILLTKSHDGVSTSNISNLHDYYFQRYGFYENLDYGSTFGKHHVQTSLTFFLFSVSKNGIREPQRQQNLVWTGSYTFNDKYNLEAVLNYAGTKSLGENKRYNVFPSIGASWIISEENFMSGIDFINYLKLRAEAGILGYESFLSPFYNEERWTRTTGSVFGPYTSGRWFGGSTESTVYRAYPSRIGNPDLDWEKRKEIEAGIEGLLFNNKLSFEINYFNNLRDGIISRITNTLPYLAGASSALPYFNYNSIRYFGIEGGLQFTRDYRKFTYSIGGNATIQNSKIQKYDQPDYRFAYQTRVGKPADSYFGQTCLGKFSSDEESLLVPQLFDAVLKEGDLKYKDMNLDGVVDDNDASAIGHTTPRLYYALNAYLRYKNLDLTIIGTGCAFFDIPLTNSYFWNGWLDNNYSMFVKDNIGGDYPRLTYYKVNNNFVASDFWLTRGDYFKIQNFELAYNLPIGKLQWIRSRAARFFVRGANLLTVSKIKDVDPESTISGVTVYPLYRTFTGGLKLNF